VSDNVYFVFSTPPPGMSLEEYGRWYDGHVEDILRVDGWVAARRFNLRAVNGDTSPTMYSHLSLYVTEGDPGEADAKLREASRAGRTPHEDWWDQVKVCSFFGDGLEGPIDLTRLDHAYIVFSRQPEQMALDDYLEWYRTHARENLTADGFDAMWRYRVTPNRIDPTAPGTSTHAAIYEVHGELPQLRAALKEAADAGRVGFPDWFGDILFASMDAPAAAATASSA
jgi:hypothetical protein